VILNVQNISKKYGSQQAVKNVSFNIAKGEIVGFLGPNGAGKSTTMKIITGCLQDYQGKVSVNSFDLQTQAIQAKSHIGFLPEENPLYDEMYIPEYLEYVANLYSPTPRKAKIVEIIHYTGLQPEIRKKIGQLSKGYRQRVGLAQAILPDPDLLVLDEPTSGLDPNQTEEMKKLLFSLSKEKAILFSSHSLSEIADICTRILFIHRGEIVLDKPTAEIKNLQLLFHKLTNE
jgi:ABC-2 type transport system ATP-binding protein